MTMVNLDASLYWLITCLLASLIVFFFFLVVVVVVVVPFPSYNMRYRLMPFKRTPRKKVDTFYKHSYSCENKRSYIHNNNYTLTNMFFRQTIELSDLAFDFVFVLFRSINRTPAAGSCGRRN